MRVKRNLSRLLAIGVLGTIAAAANAANLLKLYYDAKTDEIVMEVVYRGSHDEHAFSLDWSECKDNPFEGPPHQTGAQLIDQQFNDSGSREFTQTLRFSIANLTCRPAKLTIRTSTGANRTITVPAAPTPQ